MIEPEYIASVICNIGFKTHNLKISTLAIECFEREFPLVFLVFWRATKCCGGRKCELAAIANLMDIHRRRVSNGWL